MPAGLIRIPIAAAAFALGWFLAKRSSWSPKLVDLYGFWGLQVIALGGALGCRIGARGYGSSPSEYALWGVMPVAAFMAGILFVEIKTFWKWLAVASTVLIAILQLFYVKPF